MLPPKALNRNRLAGSTSAFPEPAPKPVAQAGDPQGAVSIKKKFPGKRPGLRFRQEAAAYRIEGWAGRGGFSSSTWYSAHANRPSEIVLEEKLLARLRLRFP
jgi:hypothetical protein